MRHESSFGSFVPIYLRTYLSVSCSVVLPDPYVMYPMYIAKESFESLPPLTRDGPARRPSKPQLDYIAGRWNAPEECDSVTPMRQLIFLSG